MSAIAGVWAQRSEPDPQSSCARMLKAQATYGPHADDQWTDDGLALGRRLFRLLPEDVYDRQPLIGAGGRFVLVADLRLDNREDLQSELNIDRDRARSLCDAAILLSAWERWEENCFERLVGNYAFAVWDREKRRLYLARDALGHRPLHYHRGIGFFAFASMPKGLLALPEVPQGPDEIQVLDFLASEAEQGPRSFFVGVKRVEPGCYVTVTAQDMRTTRHWRPARRAIKLAGPDDYVQALRHHLDQAVRAQLRGAGDRVAAHLSAGLDSSAVATTAARLLAPSAGRVVAFTAVPHEDYCGAPPPGRIGDEGTLAAATAAMHDNIDHVLVQSTGRSSTETLDRDYFLYDRPILNRCNSDWLNEINRSARGRGLTIMLVGTLGNSSLSYDGWLRLPELMAQGRFVEWWNTAQAMKRAEVMTGRGLLYYSLAHWMPGRLWDWRSVRRGGVGGGPGHYTGVNPARLPALRAAAPLRSIRRDPYFRPRIDTFEARLDALHSVDTGNYDKGDLGGWGIDLRDPTADRRLVEFCLNVPTDQFLYGGRPRSLALRALADRLPAAVLEERKRGYQAVDWRLNLTAAKNDLADRVAHLENCAPAAAAVDLCRLRSLIENWPVDGWEGNDVAVPYRLALLRGVTVGHFLQKASGGNG